MPIDGAPAHEQQPPVIRERTVDANGQHFHVLEAHGRSGPLVLFLHGFPGYAGMWRPYLAGLGAEYHAVAPDQRGYNLSSKPAAVEDYRVAFLVEDMRALVAALGHQRAYLVAHDWGGCIAWHAIAAYPEVFTKAVVMNGPHPRVYGELLAHDRGQQKKSRYVQFLRLPGAAWFLACRDFLLLRKGMFKASRRPFTDGEQRGYKEAWQRGLKYPIHYYKANFVGRDSAFWEVAHSAVPAMVLWGEQDENLSLKNLRGLETWLSRVTVKRYADATHWIYHEKCGALLGDIQAFLRDET